MDAEGIQYDIHWAQTETMRERCDQCPALEDSSVSNLGVWVTQELLLLGNGGTWKCHPVSQIQPCPPKNGTNQASWRQNRGQAHHQSENMSSVQNKSRPACSLSAHLDVPKGGHGPFPSLSGDNLTRHSSQGRRLGIRFYPETRKLIRFSINVKAAQLQNKCFFHL